MLDTIFVLINESSIRFHIETKASSRFAIRMMVQKVPLWFY